MGAAWRNVPNGEPFERVLAMVRGVRALGLEACCTLGMLNSEQAEANAIAVVYMRADLLPPADAARAHELLKRYVDQRIAFYSTRNREEQEKIADNTAQIQNELWSSIQEALEPLPPQLEGLFVSSMNDVVVSRLTIGSL